MADVDVVIRARAATREAFQQVERELQSLGANAEGVSKRTGGLAGGIKDFFTAHSASFQATAAFAAGTLAAVGALTAGVVALGVRGADVADIRGQFDALNKTVGNDTASVLGTLRASFSGTVSDMELMSLGTKAMSQGLKVGAEDFGIIGDAARVLADRGLATSTEAFGALATAMATGKTKGAEMLIGNVDLQQAYDLYAGKIGVAVKELSEEQKIAASSEAILGKLRAEVLANGKAQFDFADGAAAAKTMIQNITDALGESVAQSPVVNAMMAEFVSGAQAAFGANTQEQVRTFTGLVNEGAIMLVGIAQVAVTGADIIVRAWGGLQLLFSGTLSVITLVGQGFFKLVEGAARVASFLPGVGDSFAGLAGQAKDLGIFMGGVQTSFHDQAAAALETVKGNGDLSKSLDRIHGFLGETKAKMIAAKGATVEVTTATANLTARKGALIEATGRSAKANDAETVALGKLKEAADKAEMGFAGFGGEVQQSWQRERVWLEQVIRYPDALNAFTRAAGDGAIGTRGITSAINDLAGASRPAMGDLAGLAATSMSLGQTFNSVFKGLPGTIAEAFKGGGGVSGALNAFGMDLGSSLFGPKGAFSGIAKSATGALSGVFGQTIGTALSAAFPLIGGLIAPGLNLLWGGIKKLFGGPSKAELEGRDLVSQFEAQVASMLTNNQKLEAGGDKWKQTVIAVRDAYIANGLTAAQAEKDVAALWASSKGGADKTREAIAKIQGAIEANAAALGRVPAKLPNPFADWKMPAIDIPEATEDIPGFAGGGVVQAGRGGLAVLHGREAVIPLDRPSAIGSQLVRTIIQAVPSARGESSDGRIDGIQAAMAELARTVSDLPGTMLRGFRDAALVSGGA